MNIPALFCDGQTLLLRTLMRPAEKNVSNKEVCVLVNEVNLWKIAKKTTNNDRSVHNKLVIVSNVRV